MSPVGHLPVLSTIPVLGRLGSNGPLRVDRNAAATITLFVGAPLAGSVPAQKPLPVLHAHGMPWVRVGAHLASCAAGSYLSISRPA